MTLPDHVRRNRRLWDRWATDYLRAGRRAWAAAEPTWGIWGIPERDLGVLPGVSGLDVVELGCGTAYWSAWLARRGARPVGIDSSERQLASARLLQREHGLEFPLVLASAEQVPLNDERFDLAFSEYGASIWCDPYRWIPEAARLLRPGGRLIFLRNGLTLMLCMPPEGPAGDRLVRDAFGLHRVEWSDEDSVEFHLPHGAWIDLFRTNGLSVDRLLELQPPAGASTRYDFVSLEWARRWPSEEIWVVRKE